MNTCPAEVWPDVGLAGLRRGWGSAVCRVGRAVAWGWYQHVFADTGRAPAAWMLAGFLVTFAVTRASAATKRWTARAG